jgi:hypothetical protein
VLDSISPRGVFAWLLKELTHRHAKRLGRQLCKTVLDRPTHPALYWTGWLSRRRNIERSGQQ